MNRRAAEVLTGLCFVVSAAAGGLFVTAYVLGWGTFVMGGTMAAALAFLATGLLLWSSGVLQGATFVETREPMQPSAAEQDAFVEAGERGPRRSPGMLRRTLLLSLLGLGAAAVVPLRSLIPSGLPAPWVQLSRTEWRTGRKRLMTHDGELIKLDEVDVGSEITFFPDGHKDDYYATGVLLRLSDRDAALLSPEVRAGTVQGAIAFSKLCTHAGCPVGLYEQTSRQLFCPCHQSVFDVLQGAKPTAGPAARALPQLPLDVDGAGYLVATGDFRGKAGPTYWTNYGSPQ